MITKNLGIASYNFRDDIKHGKQAEEFSKRFVIMYLERFGMKKPFTFYNNNDNMFDYLVVTGSGRYIEVEVKYDSIATKTGNIAIEFNCRGKDSGINTTWSDLYVFVLNDRVMICPTYKIKRMIEKYSLPYKEIGDDNLSKNYLPSLKFFIEEINPAIYHTN